MKWLSAVDLSSWVLLGIGLVPGVTLSVRSAARNNDVIIHAVILSAALIVSAILSRLLPRNGWLLRLGIAVSPVIALLCILSTAFAYAILVIVVPVASALDGLCWMAGGIFIFCLPAWGFTSLFHDLRLNHIKQKN